MPRAAARFVLVLVAGLGLLTLAGYLVMAQTLRDWFETDLELRSQLAVRAARESLREDWDGNRERLTRTLANITRDERIMAAAACSSDAELIAATDAFPEELTCEELVADFGSVGSTHGFTDLPSGPVFRSVIPVGGDGDPLGVVVLVHDLSFVGGREATTRNLLLAAFFVLALAAAVITLVAARLTWRGWTSQLRQALSGSPTAEFQPLVRDVRALVEQLTSEAENDARGGRWSPERLRATLTQHLHGERIVILANREPYIHSRKSDGSVEVLHPASGLVTALEPVMRACSGTWVAHGAGSADRDTVDAHDRVRVPPGEESYAIRRVWLSEEEERGYYYGFANEGLWPLCHVAHSRPIFRAGDWEHYQHANRRFADAVCAEVDSDEPVVLVQDYHFALAPRMIREKLPRATILTFWHTPWPNAERLGICPWRTEIIQGLLGSSIVGFHTQQHCNNFLDSVDAYVESRIDRETRAVVQGPRRTLVRAYPISIEWPVHWLKHLPPAAECRKQVRERLGLPPDALLGVGVDRIDYTKGIEERLGAVDELLRLRPELRGRFVFAQLGAPSRTKIPLYRELNERLETLASEINARWGTESYRPIVLLRSHHEPPEVFTFFRAADVCYVSSLHDGMNLVAKEFVAARDDEQGVLVLSEFTGAARDLTEALVVNPYDLREAAEALGAAVQMPVVEQRDRMRSMRRLVSEFNVYRWAGRMLVDAADVRRRERLSGRLSSQTRRTRLGA